MSHFRLKPSRSIFFLVFWMIVISSTSGFALEKNNISHRNSQRGAARFTLAPDRTLRRERSSPVIQQPLFSSKSSINVKCEKLPNVQKILLPLNNMASNTKHWTGSHRNKAYFVNENSKSNTVAVQSVASSTRKKTPAAETSKTLASTTTTKSSSFSLPRKVDMSIICFYLCHIFACTLPVVFIPIAAAEQVAHPTLIPATVASIASTATLGGAFGKFINGFVCQQVGGRQSSLGYIICMAVSCVLLSMSTTPQQLAWSLCAIEFCSSMQWVALNVILANHYRKEPTKFATGITFLSLASTSGTIAAKMLGTLLLQLQFSWRMVARFGAVICFLGCIIMYGTVKEHPRGKQIPPRPKLELEEIVSTIKHVTGSPLFWHVGIAHAFVFLIRSSERVMAVFFHDAISLPRNVCGGLTTSVTLGYLHGLITGRAFYSFKDVSDKMKLLKRRYASAVLSALGLAVISNTSIVSWLAQAAAWLPAAMATLITGCLASSVAFQFYQIPASVSKTFAHNQGVASSYNDGLGFLFSTVFWGSVGRIVGHPLVGSHGWSVVWTILALLIAFSGGIMIPAIKPILLEEAALKPARA